VTECREPVFLGRVVDGCQRERDALVLGKVRLAAWAWRVAYDRYPALYDTLKGSL
jgi:hypothetical protein